jgi:asparagine synthase (glutamine-hydrolysing)
MQPMQIDQCVLICNGEIYNSADLHKKMGVRNGSGSDCEIIIHLYLKYGIEQTLRMLDGVYSFVLLDIDKEELFVARDLFGVRPLFCLYDTGYTLGFASEIKTLVGLKTTTAEIRPFPPGTYRSYIWNNNSWEILCNRVFATTAVPLNKTIKTALDAQQLIAETLIIAVKKRVYSTERPIACLLSGGLDSSLVTAIVREFVPKNTLETYSIGLLGSEDLRYARKVANFLGTKHTEIICTEQEFLTAIPEVIEAIESYDTTTVRASVGNYLVSKYIKNHSQAKVIFNGDGADEVCGGYMYFHAAPDAIAFDQECRRLLKDIHMFDVLRSDRSISSNGLEPRTPFLDRHFVETYLSIPTHLRALGNGKCEKYLLRHAFEDLNLLPHEVLFRTKEAFSDGVSNATKSWFEIIQEYVETLEFPVDESLKHNKPQTKEQQYYRFIFENKYKDCGKVIDYFWMPKFVEATDSSARTLKIYKEKNIITSYG